ncbi:MAG: glycoside hydrolase family 25 protein [Firmicutes bacterium]|nr:glycoside hydrolase family 25 protein [Bacillota bacterium]
MQTRSPQYARGIDVSAYQGSVDWTQVAGAGISFAFIKATEGQTLTDPQFAVNYPDAQAAGILRGSYHYAQPGADTAVAEADFYVKTVKAAGGFNGLPPVLDIESTGGLDNATLLTWINQWMQEVRTQTEMQPILYTNPNFASTHLDPSLGTIPLWVANYNVTHPADASGWTAWTFWQYSDTGTVPGIKGYVDLDVYLGSVSALRSAYPTSALRGQTYTEQQVFVQNQPFKAIAVDGVTYVIWSALVAVSTVYAYKGSGLMDIDGTLVQGIIYQGNTYLPWYSLHSGITATRVFSFTAP